MARRGEDLAARFRQAIDHAETERKRREDARKRRLEEGRRARRELFEDLASFAQAVGHLAVEHDDDGVTLRYDDRHLRFEAMGEGDRVRVSFDKAGEDEHRLYREPELGNRWVWAMRRRGREDRLLLFDAGLEELLVLALELPRPGVGETPQAEPTLDEAVPGSRPRSEGDDGEEPKRTL